MTSESRLIDGHWGYMAIAVIIGAAAGIRRLIE